MRHWPVSDGVRVAFAPDATYGALVEDASSSSLIQLIGRVALANAVLICIMPLMVTGGITLESLAFSVVYWGFVAVLQALLGAAVIAASPSRRVSALRALDLWFAAHLPYSAWLLIVGVSVMFTNRLAQVWVLPTALVPAIWTSNLLTSYCRVVLATTERGARRRIAAEQLVAWAFVTAYVLFAAGGASGIVGSVARQIGWER